MSYFVGIFLIMRPVVEMRNSNSAGLSAVTNDAEPYSASTSGSDLKKGYLSQNL